METTTHQRLKHLAVAFLRERGCRAVATEVRCPISRYRADVAGYIDTVPEAAPPLVETGTDRGRRAHSRRCPARTVIIECKRSRADFLRERQDRESLLRQREALERFRERLEEKRIKVVEPALRRSGTALFADLEEWDFASSRLPAYRDILRRLRKVDQMLHGQTKFCLAARYALADRLYLATPRGLIRRRELPPGWGLLECGRRDLRRADFNADLFGDSVLRITVAAPAHAARELHRARLLRNIAVSASAAAARGLGILA